MVFAPKIPPSSKDPVWSLYKRVTILDDFIGRGDGRYVQRAGT